MSTWRPVRAWQAWALIVLGVTLVMRLLRDDLDQAHVALIYLLVVLGASVGGGRALGLTLSCVAFLLIDYFFQPPYDTLAISRFDWTVLITFLATAAVATELLAQAQGEGREARRRADEVDGLSRLGAETLNAPRAEDALARIAEVIQRTLGGRECEICLWGPAGLAAGAVAGALAPRTDLDRERMRRVAESGRALVVSTDGIEVEGRSAGTGLDPVVFQTPDTETILIPLQGATRVVGVLRIAGTTQVVFDAPKRSFLTALSYYTALGVERVHLVAEAAHAEALREADRMKDILLASISHDLRTPLTTIKALAQDLSLRGDETARVIEQQADRLGRMVADVLDLSRIKGGVVRVSPELNTAEDLLGAALAQLPPDEESRTVQLAVDMEHPALVGTFDFVQSLRILNNLIENALRFSPPGGQVDLSVVREGESLVRRRSGAGCGTGGTGSDLRGVLSSTGRLARRWARRPRPRDRPAPRRTAGWFRPLPSSPRGRQHLSPPAPRRRPRRRLTRGFLVKS